MIDKFGYTVFVFSNPRLIYVNKKYHFNMWETKYVCVIIITVITKNV